MKVKGAHYNPLIDCMDIFVSIYQITIIVGAVCMVIMSVHNSPVGMNRAHEMRIIMCDSLLKRDSARLYCK